jgi:hypothetical protein
MSRGSTRRSRPSFLCVPEVNRDELLWSHMKRTGVARAPLRRGATLRNKVEAQLACSDQSHATVGPAIRSSAS